MSRTTLCSLAYFTVGIILFLAPPVTGSEQAGGQPEPPAGWFGEEEPPLEKKIPLLGEGKAEIITPGEGKAMLSAVTIDTRVYHYKRTRKFNELWDVCNFKCTEPPESPCKGKCTKIHRENKKPLSFETTTLEEVKEGFTREVSLKLGTAFSGISAEFSGKVETAFETGMGTSVKKAMSTELTFGCNTHFAEQTELKVLKEGYYEAKSGRQIEVTITTHLFGEEGRASPAEVLLHHVVMQLMLGEASPSSQQITQDADRIYGGKPAKGVLAAVSFTATYFTDCTWTPWQEVKDENCEHITQTTRDDDGGGLVELPPAPDPAPAAEVRGEDATDTTQQLFSSGRLAAIPAIGTLIVPNDDRRILVRGDEIMSASIVYADGTAEKLEQTPDGAYLTVYDTEKKKFDEGGMLVILQRVGPAAAIGATIFSLVWSDKPNDRKVSSVPPPSNGEKSVKSVFLKNSKLVFV